MSSDSAKQFYDALKRTIEKDAIDRTTQGYLWGVNVRLNLRKAFEAAAIAAAAGFSIAKIISGIPDPSDVPAMVGMLGFWSTLLDAVRKKMRASQYVTCVFLGDKSDGVQKKDLIAAVKAFVEAQLGQHADPHSGLGKKQLETALIELQEAHTDSFLEDMSDFVEIDQDIVKVRSVNFTFGLRGEG